MLSCVTKKWLSPVSEVATYWEEMECLTLLCGDTDSTGNVLQGMKRNIGALIELDGRKWDEPPGC